MEENTIINGNCLDFISEFPNNAFIISDPPYNQKYHYLEYKDNLKEKEYFDMLYKIFNDRKSVIIHYPEEIINLLGGKLGRCEQVVSWVYNSNTAKQHRLVTWWNCNPDLRKVGQDYKNPTDKRIAQRIKEGKRARLYDWWEINQVKNVSKKHSHPCPLPEELVRRIILTTTNEGDLIIDPFCGIGTVCKIAKQLNRKYIGIELSKEYYEEAKLNV
jgi:DNA modification methylase